MKKNNSKWVRVISYFLISFLLVFFLLHQVGIKKVFFVFQRIYWPAFFIYLFLASINIFVRAYRYKVLIKEKDFKIGNLIAVTIVRNCAVDLLPGRLGELSYIYLLRKKFRLPLEEASSSFILAVLFDYLTAFLALAFSLILVSSLFNERYFLFFILLQFIAFIFLFLILIFLTEVITFFKKLVVYFLKGKWGFWLSDFFEKIKVEINQAKKRKVYFFVFFLSLLIRFFKYFSLYFLAYSFFSAYSITLKDLSFAHIVLGVTGAEITSFLPIKGIAGLGTWEMAWAVVMRLLKYPVEWGVATGFGVHLSTQIFEYSLAIFALFYIYFRKGNNKIEK